MAARRAKSPAIPASQFPGRIKRDATPPVVVAAGAERWLRAQIASHLIRKVLPDGDPGGALIRLDAKATEDKAQVANAIDEMRSASLFATSKVVIVDNAETTLFGGKRGAPALLALAEAACSSAAPGAHMLLLTPRPVKGKSAVATAKLAKAGALVVDCRSLYDAPGPWERGAVAYDHELSRFVAARLKTAYGKRFGLEDAHLLTQVVGTDLGELDGALRSLSLYVGTRDHVSAEDIEASIGATREDPIWRLADAVFERRTADAVALVEAAFERGITDQRGAVVSRPEALAPLIQATLFSSWRRILAGAEGLARGEAQEQVARAAGVPPFLSGPFAARCRRDPAGLLALAACFYAAENGIKGGGVPPRLATERLVVELATR